MKLLSCLFIIRILAQSFITFLTLLVLVPYFFQWFLLVSFGHWWDSKDPCYIVWQYLWVVSSFSLISQCHNSLKFSPITMSQIKKKNNQVIHNSLVTLFSATSKIIRSLSSDIFLVGKRSKSKVSRFKKVFSFASFRFKF